MGKTEAKLLGIDKVVADLNKVLQKTKVKSLEGLIKSAIIVRRDMDKVTPKIPIDTGNLRASWYVTTTKGTEGSGSFKGEDATIDQGEHEKRVAEASAFVSTYKYPVAVMGFSAAYATYVHEMVNANFAGKMTKLKYNSAGKITAATKKYSRREGAGAKFFESSLQRNMPKIFVILGKEVKL